MAETGYFDLFVLLVVEKTSGVCHKKPLQLPTLGFGHRFAVSAEVHRCGRLALFLLIKGPAPNANLLQQQLQDNRIRTKAYKKTYNDLNNLSLQQTIKLQNNDCAIWVVKFRRDGKFMATGG